MLYDHSPSALETNIAAFVDQIDSVEYLNLFITSLKNLDVLKELYSGREEVPKAKTHRDMKVYQIHPGSYDQTSLSAGSVPKELGSIMRDDEEDTKINRICTCLRDELLKRDMIHYMEPLLSSYVKSEPPQLEKALDMILNITSKILAMTNSKEKMNDEHI